MDRLRTVALGAAGLLWRITGSALAFRMMTWASGSLYVAMGVQALYDLAAGPFYGKHGEELGYAIEAMPPPEASAVG
jgi:hypothetical protein